MSGYARTRAERKGYGGDVLNRKARRAKARVEKRLGRTFADEQVQVVLAAEDLTRAKVGPGAGQGRRAAVQGQNRGR